MSSLQNHMLSTAVLKNLSVHQAAQSNPGMYLPMAMHKLPEILFLKP